MHSRFPHRTALAIVMAALIPSCRHERHESEAPPALQVTRPLRTDTEVSAEYVGQIRAIQHIELRALEKGYLEGIYVDEGQVVRKGQRMFQLMPAVYQAELMKAEAEAEFARIEYENTKALAEGNVVSANELALAKAKLNKANAEKALAQVHRSLTEIRAPFDGLMGRFHARRGSLLDEGELLTTLSDNSRMWVYFNVTEAEYLDYKTQMADKKQFGAKLIMANGQPFAEQGVVDTIESDFNNETGTIAFRATFPNEQQLLRHGETGKVTVTRPLKGAILIPQKATFEILDKKRVYVVGEDNVVHSRAVVVGVEMPQTYAIASGLDENETILLDGIQRVRDNERITPLFVDPKEVMSHLEVHAE